MNRSAIKLGMHTAVLPLLMACSASQPDPLPPLTDNSDNAALVSRSASSGNSVNEKTRALYASVQDKGHAVAAIPDAYLSREAARRIVTYHAPYPPGTIVVDPGARRLYHILPGGRATRYLVGVGAAGFEFSGEATIPFQRAWPYWTPTPEMLRREPEKYGPVRDGLPGGSENPLGARALYLYQGARDTLYRIHGTPYPWSVGQPNSAGCIRMFNQDVMHLAANVKNGTKVVVLPKEASGKWARAAGG